jgi:hypothetical protein
LLLGFTSLKILGTGKKKFLRINLLRFDFGVLILSDSLLILEEIDILHLGTLGTILRALRLGKVFKYVIKDLVSINFS